jgi:tetratricopeptide (TPR) repeat protein
MRSRRVPSLLIVVVAVLGLLVVAQMFADGGPDVEAWGADMAAAVGAIGGGRFDDAEKRLAAAVDEAELFPPFDPRVGETIEGVRDLFRAQGLTPADQVLYQRALAIRKSARNQNGDKSDQADEGNLVLMFFSDRMRRIAHLYSEDGMDAEALAVFKRAVTIKEMALGRGHIRLASEYDELARLWVSTGDAGGAEGYLRRALELRELHLGPDHEDVAQSLETVARFLRTSGMTDEPARMEARARAIRAGVPQ